MTHMMSICEKNVWHKHNLFKQKNFFIEFHHFMETKLTQLETKQLKQNIFKSMGIYGFS